MLRPGAPFIVSFSNRCFPTKAGGRSGARWTPRVTRALVQLYLERAGFTDIQVDVLQDGAASDPLTAVTGRA